MRRMRVFYIPRKCYGAFFLRFTSFTNTLSYAHTAQVDAGAQSWEGSAYGDFRFQTALPQRAAHVT